MRWEAKRHQVAAARLGRRMVRMWCCVEVGVVDEPGMEELDKLREEEKERWKVEELVEAYERQHFEGRGLWRGLDRMRQALGISHFRVW